MSELVGLAGLRVVDLSTEIAGPCCTRMLADAGADVVKVEPAGGGDPLRGWSASGAEVGEAGALFRFLHAGKRSVIGEIEDPAVAELLAGADLLVESLPAGRIDEVALARRFPRLAWVSITPFGRGGPLDGRPATEFTLQAESGSIAARGLPEGVPFQAGGRISEWMAGAFAAVPALACALEARRGGPARRVDVSILEASCLSSTTFLDLFWSLFGRPDPPPGPARSIETPSIEPTADGWVGFCTNSGQQFRDFLVLLERPDLLEDPELALAYGRILRFREWNEIVRAWTTRHSTAEIVERAAALRIPVAPVNDADGVLAHEQLAARGVWRRAPEGDFTHPRPPWLFDGSPVPARGPAPRLGEHTGRIDWPAREQAPAKVGTGARPLEGLRILDLTTWWAGPASTHVLASLGADVIHVESIQKPDGMRYVGGAFLGHERWWELSAFFLSVNASKRGLTLDLSRPEGRELLERLVGSSDAMVENYTPRVMEQFGLTTARLHEIHPGLVLVRMPAFGLDGPWRDRPAFAQTVEQISGLAWVTGHRDDQPRIQRGPCDPLAGMHGAFALLVALEERRRTGRGLLVEVPMVETAIQAAVELVIERTAYGARLERSGNRSPHRAPQGIFRCRGEERWLALSVATDEQWQGLVGALGSPDWACAASLATAAGREAAQDHLERELAAWAADLDLDDALARLVAAGVPAAVLTDPRYASREPQMAARGFFETMTHPAAGTHPIPTLPFRVSGIERWTRLPAPTLGEHSREILRDRLGLTTDEIESLAVAGIIGERPAGA